MDKLEGKVALVIGGNSGIGLATTKRLATEGTHVFITGRRDGELAAAVKEIGKNVTGVGEDVSKLGDPIFCSRRLNGRRAGSISCPQMPVSRNTLPLARSPRSSTTGFSTSM